MRRPTKREITKRVYRILAEYLTINMQDHFDHGDERAAEVIHDMALAFRKRGATQPQEPAR